MRITAKRIVEDPQKEDGCGHPLLLCIGEKTGFGAELNHGPGFGKLFLLYRFDNAGDMIVHKTAGSIGISGF